MHSVLKVHIAVITIKIQAKAFLSGLKIHVGSVCQWFSSLPSSDSFYLWVLGVTVFPPRNYVLFISSDLISFLVSSSIQQVFEP